MKIRQDDIYTVSKSRYRYISKISIFPRAIGYDKIYRYRIDIFDISKHHYTAHSSHSHRRNTVLSYCLSVPLFVSLRMRITEHCHASNVRRSCNPRSVTESKFSINQQCIPHLMNMHEHAPVKVAEPSDGRDSIIPLETDAQCKEYISQW